MPYTSVDLDKFFFPLNKQQFSVYEIHFNNLDLGCPIIFINQIDFCFLKLYFGPLIRTIIEYINEQLLVDVYWPNKVIWKSALNKATKDVLIFEKSF